MKLNKILAVCGISAALFLGANNVFGQADNAANGNAGNNGNGGFGNGGNNGNGGGRGGRGNFDPAQMQQRMMQRVQEELSLTNDTEWSAIEPLVQKVMDAQRDARSSQLRGLMGRNRGQQGNQNGGQQAGGRGGFGGTPSPEAEALQKAIDDNAPKAQIKDLLSKYEASQNAKKSKLTAAQSDLRKVLTVKQEAQATLIGLLD